MNLHKTLKAYNESGIDIERSLVLNEAKNILEKSQQEDVRTLSMLGMDINLVSYQKIQVELNQSKRYDEVYDISIIKKMAIDYGLRFLPSNYYCGHVDPYMPTALNQFCKKHSIYVQPTSPIGILKSQWDSNYQKEGEQFFILAPKESFNLQQEPKDPILFYKINENKYALVYKWGNDLSSLRKIKNYPFRSYYHMFSFYILSIIAVSIGLCFLTRDVLPMALLMLCLFWMPIGLEFRGNDKRWNSKYK